MGLIEYNRNYYTENRERILVEKKLYYSNNKETSNKKTAERRMKQKQEILDNYGKVCQCCGESNPVFLVIDHIDGGGNRQRKSTGGGSRFYNWLKKNDYPLGFQVLCCNCNWGKHIRGICPHKLGGTIANQER